jgi:hypothetical protein
MLMPFGKHKGLEIDSLPDGYLLWLRENIELREPLRTHVLTEIDARGLLDGTERTGDLDAGRIKKIFRELAFEFHPDRGGNVEIMKGINIFFERLTK